MSLTKKHFKHLAHMLRDHKPKPENYKTVDEYQSAKIIWDKLASDTLFFAKTYHKGMGFNGGTFREVAGMDSSY